MFCFVSLLPSKQFYFVHSLFNGERSASFLLDRYTLTEKMRNKKIEKSSEVQHSALQLSHRGSKGKREGVKGLIKQGLSGNFSKTYQNNCNERHKSVYPLPRSVLQHNGYSKITFVKKTSHALSTPLDFRPVCTYQLSSPSHAPFDKPLGKKWK